mmetsp:Transcript_26535/g.68495  ORF Transcript_26535/g.68495 Transcript_26535/m.68495 type:complete len:204 (-) Transcript_26535:116-727(-)
MVVRALERVLFAHTRYVVSFAAFVALVVGNDSSTTICVSGAIANAICNKVLKRLIAQRRPPGSPLHDPGMPSSHATSLLFFCAYLTAVLLRSTRPYRIVEAATLISLSTAAAMYRVRAGYHTLAQVVVGGLIGATAGVAWHELARPRLVGAFDGRRTALFAAAIVAIGSIYVSATESKLFPMWPWTSPLPCDKEGQRRRLARG